MTKDIFTPDYQLGEEFSKGGKTVCPVMLITWELQTKQPFAASKFCVS